MNPKIANYKRIALHLAIGPGDSLRFKHMLDSMGGGTRTAVLTKHASNTRYLGMFSGADQPAIRGSGIPGVSFCEDGPVLWILSPTLNDAEKKPYELEKKTGALLQSLGIGSADFKGNKFESKIVHVYGSRLSRQRATSIPLEPNKKVDTYRNDIDGIMGRHAINIPGLGARSVPRPPLNILVAIREDDDLPHGHRNTPQAMLDAIQEVVESMPAGERARITRFGSTPAELRTHGWQAYEAGGKSYLRQIHDLSEYDMVVGANSGGLDLAAAAGLPVLRVCEYHGYPGHEGKLFNFFLTGALTVGLRPANKESFSGGGEWFDVAQFRTAFATFIDLLSDNTSFVGQPRFTIIDAGEDFTLDNYARKHYESF